MDGRSIRVTIFGSEYPLRGESEELTRSIAQYVDEMIRTIHAKIPDQPPLTIAVLSALNIAEDLFKEREKNQYQIELFSRELKKIAGFLEQSLSEADAKGVVG
ncbi:MAG: cell division protein ZapA [Bacteroidota bacterium]